MRPVHLPALALWLWLPLAATAAPVVTPESLAEADGPSWTTRPLDYYINKLQPPPRPGSYRDRMDLGDAIARQHAVTREDLKSIQRTYLFTVFTFDRAIGPGFTSKKFPKTAAFFKKLANTANLIINGLKDNYKRPRPFQAHPDRIKLLVPNEPGYSYPSGHTTRSRLCALVLSQLIPEKRQAILAIADTVGIDRILAGEHYLTDLEGGRSLGKIIFYELGKNQNFQNELAALRAEEWTPRPKTPIE
jgi:acid phosphatase (class A)